MAHNMRTYCSVWVMKSRKNGRIWWKEKFSFHHENAPAHTSVIAVSKINDLQFKLFPQTPYLLDYAPSDYYLFQNLKKWLGGKRFSNNEEVESAVNGYFMELVGSYYKQGIEAI